MSFQQAIDAVDVTIESSGTTSSAANVYGKGNVVAVETPSALTGTSFTFEASTDGSTYVPLYNEGTQYSVTVGTSRYVALDPAVFAGVKWVKVVSGSSEAASRTITIVTAGIVG